MDISILEDIGLTGAEIKVFITLLELGSTQAGKVVEKSGLQNAVVHRAFHSLIEKGLVTYILEGKIKKYQSIEPKLLLTFIDEKRDKLSKIIPELEAKKNLLKENPKATIFHGVRGVKELLWHITDTKNEKYYGYGGSLVSNDITGKHFWLSFNNRRLERNIAAELIFHKSLESWGKKISKMGKTVVKVTENDFEELTETVICGSKVGIIIWLDKPFGFLIEEDAAARSYKKFFDILWESEKTK